MRSWPELLPWSAVGDPDGDNIQIRGADSGAILDFLQSSASLGPKGQKPCAEDSESERGLGSPRYYRSLGERGAHMFIWLNLHVGLLLHAA